MGIFEQEDILYDVKESDLDTNLNLDVSVVSEKSDYSTSSLDKIGIKVFSDETDEIINRLMKELLILLKARCF